MKTFKRVFIVAGACVAVFLLYVQLTYKRKFEVPVTGIESSTDSVIIARGKYLVTGAAHCYTCHMPDSLLKQGKKEPMIGGLPFHTPFATFYTANLTPDKETGIGAYSDEQLARAIRYNLSHDALAMVPVMSYNRISDEDLKAIISYLRSAAPVRNEVPEHDFNMLGKILSRFLLKPVQAGTENILPDTTVEYGRYLTYNVTNCNGCHTNRGGTGEFIGAPFAGGYSWDLEHATFTAPNLTPDDSTGRISKWSQTAFVQRFRTGNVLPGSPMPWDAYKTVSDNDLKAIYKFLNSLPPTKNKIENTYVPKQK